MKKLPLINFQMTLQDEAGQFFIKLKILVEQAYETNEGQRVTLMGHSLGGLMSLIFLQRQDDAWKEKYIDKFIALAAPWGGSVKALKVFAIGTDFTKIRITHSSLSTNVYR